MLKKCLEITRNKKLEWKKVTDVLNSQALNTMSHEETSLYILQCTCHLLCCEIKIRRCFANIVSI